METPLSKTSAEDALTLYTRTKNCLNDLEVSVETYLGLVTQTYQEPDEPPAVGTEGAAGVDGLQVLIDTHINNLAVYSTKVIDIRTNNIETFRSIDSALNPIQCNTNIFKYSNNRYRILDIRR